MSVCLWGQDLSAAAGDSLHSAFLFGRGLALHPLVKTLRFLLGGGTDVQAFTGGAHLNGAVAME